MITNCLRCQSLARIRGLCRTCYEIYRSRINAGATTWAELVEDGRALAPAGQKHPFRHDLNARVKP